MRRNFPMTCGLRLLETQALSSFQKNRANRAATMVKASLSSRRFPGPESLNTILRFGYAISMMTRPPLTIMPPPSNIRSSGTCPKSTHEIICETRKNNAI